LPAALWGNGNTIHLLRIAAPPVAYSFSWVSKMTLPHVRWLVQKKSINTDEGKVVEVWDLQHIDDAKVLSTWAKHFRQHYILDSQIDTLRKGTGKSRADYLRDHKFPTTDGLGASVRAGDFAEILVCDFIEFIQGYWCPRERYILKWNQNESTKGSDVVGFRFAADTESPKDSMYVLESKTTFAATKENRLQKAVDDSAKDPVRYAATLNALKQRFIERKDDGAAAKIERFQDPTDNPYVFLNGAVLVCTDQHYDEALLKQTVCETHPNKDKLTLFVVSGSAMMDLTNALYERAANEA